MTLPQPPVVQGNKSYSSDDMLFPGCRTVPAGKRFPHPRARRCPSGHRIYHGTAGVRSETFWQARFLTSPGRTPISKPERRSMNTMMSVMMRDMMLSAMEMVKDFLLYPAVQPVKSPGSRDRIRTKKPAPVKKRSPSKYSASDSHNDSHFLNQSGIGRCD